jgi:hypothetical protein
MPSEVEICSDALLLLGEEPILSFDDLTKKARLCSRFYPQVRDAVLRAYPWRCAIVLGVLNQLAGSDVLVGTGYSYTYQLPVDPYCLRALLLNDDKAIPWEVIGRKLVTDESVVTLKYIAKITDPGLFDSLLIDVIATRLAQQIAYPVTGNPAMTKALIDIYQMKLMEARSIDSMEGSIEDYESSGLLDVR